MIAWSYSRLQVYRDCPAKFKYKFIDKLPEPGSAAMDRGSDIHKALEKYVAGANGGKKPVAFPKLYKDIAVRVKTTLDEFRQMDPAVELELAFTQKLERVDWFDKQTWLRVKVDISYSPKVGQRVLLDYKTGKIKFEEHQEQLRLYSWTSIMTEPKMKQLATGIFYVDHESKPRIGTLIKTPFTGQLKELTAYWRQQVKPLERDTKFTATPEARRCGWCHYSFKKGGPCKAAKA